MDVTFTLPDAVVPKLLNAMAENYGYKTTIKGIDETGTEKDIPNPQSKADFARQMTVNFWKDNLNAYELKAIRKAAEQSSVLTEITYT